MNIERLKEIRESFLSQSETMSKEDIIKFTDKILKSYIHSEQGHEIAASLFYDLMEEQE